MNEAIFIVWMVTALFALVGVYKAFGAPGMIAVIAGNVVIMNVLVTKGVVLFGVGATAGNVLYGMIFLATDILTEFHGGREARRAVRLGFVAGVIAFGASMAALFMQPAEWDWAHSHLEAILWPMARILAGSWVAYYVSQTFDTHAYGWLKRKGLPLWVRNNGSTIASQGIDTLIFCTIGLLGSVQVGVWWQIVLSTYLLKVIVAGIDTPFLYLARRIRKRTQFSA